MNINNFGRTTFVNWTEAELRQERQEMTEHLFKLKKGGKTVGYYKFATYRDGGDMELQMSTDGKNWSSGDLIDFTSIHPFVTKDKNGDDVFAGDRVRSGKRILTIVWEKENLQWKAKEDNYTYLTPLCQWAISEQFELIKGKE